MGAVDNAIDNKEGRLPIEARNILQSLASDWDDIIDSKALHVIPLKGAMTNEVYQIKWPTKTETVSRKVLVRIYGEGVEVFFDREDEIQTFEFISKYGQGPRLLGRFPNGRIEEFINARTLSASDLRDPETSAIVAAKMKEFHDIDRPGPKTITLWDRLRKWLSTAQSLSSPEEATEFHLDVIEEEIFALEKALSVHHQRIGFCHNDLQYGNIMINEETKSMTIIDYEYASYNPVAYDIANHFCEMAADYHTETPHLLDYSKYPGLEERQRFLRVYLSSSGDQISDIELDHLVQDVEKYTLANHLFWGLWGIISEHVNEIDFDYMEYARQRLQQYWSTKPALLGSSGSSPDGNSKPALLGSSGSSPDGNSKPALLGSSGSSPDGNSKPAVLGSSGSSPDGNLKPAVLGSSGSSPDGNSKPAVLGSSGSSPDGNSKPAVLGSSGSSPDGKEEQESTKKTSSKQIGLFKKLKKYLSLSKTKN